MARTNRIASQYAHALRKEGWVYSRNGHPSIPAKTYEAIQSWEDWCKGVAITPNKLRNIYTLMSVSKGYARGNGPRSSALLGLDPDALISMSEATDKLGLLVDGSVRWHQALDKIDLDTKNYVLNALKRKDNVRSPRIMVSTIHSMKGGEADNVVLFTEISPAASKAAELAPDDLHRVFYVGITRTKQNLYLVEPDDATRSYQI